MQQIERVRQDAPPKVSFEVKFKNGIIANPTSLEEIFALENIGSAAIVRLLIRLENGVEPISSIKLEFIDVSNDPEPGYNAVSYTVIGEDRDWVFVTSSQIEERISRIKTLATLDLFSRQERYRGCTLLIMIILVIFLFGMIFTFTSLMADLPSVTETRLQTIDSLEAKWKSGEFTDPIEIILELERAQARQLDWTGLEILGSPGAWGVWIAKTVALPIVILILLGFAIYSCAYFFPAYNFIWGDYTKVYEKRKGTGKFVLGTIILAIILSVVGNYFSALLGIGR